MKLISVESHEYKLIELNRTVSVKVNFLVKLHRIDLSQLLAEELLGSPNEFVFRQSAAVVHIN